MSGENTPKDNDMGTGEGVYDYHDISAPSGNERTQGGDLVEGREIIFDKVFQNTNASWSSHDTAKKSEKIHRDSSEDITKQREKIENIREKIEKNDVDTSTLYDNVQEKIDSKILQNLENTPYTQLEQLERIGTHEAKELSSHELNDNSERSDSGSPKHIKSILNQPKYSELSSESSRASAGSQFLDAKQTGLDNGSSLTSIYVSIGFILGLITLLMIIFWQQA